MQISFSPYQLMPLEGSLRNLRNGALIKVVQNDGSFGYADCHPWPELGDDSLSDQLSLMKQGIFNSLTRQSIKFAEIDANARKEKFHLFNGLMTPKNHFQVSDLFFLSNPLLEKLAREGVNIIKIKLSGSDPTEIETIERFFRKLQSLEIKLRLDFNGKLEQEQFIDFLNKSSKYLDIVDYFEDPFRYDPLSWQEVREEKQIKLACDRGSEQALNFPHSCDVLVVKPAIQEITPFLTSALKNRRLVLTSYLDHPIGQLSALYIASKIHKEHPAILSECGFLTHHVYTQTLFSSSFKQKGSRLIPSKEGLGWGFDAYLEQLNWSRLT